MVRDVVRGVTPLLRSVEISEHSQEPLQALLLSCQLISLHDHRVSSRRSLCSASVYFNTQCIVDPREDSLESPQASPLACQRCARITRVHYVALINHAAWSVFIAARAIVAQGMRDMILGHFGLNDATSPGMIKRHM